MPVRMVEMPQIHCCVCDAPGPLAATRVAATSEAIAVGWEVVFGFALCPSCNEQGLLPADTPEIRVSLPQALPTPHFVTRK